MATINVSLPSDGQTADAADINTPINTIVNEFNGNIENANIKTGAAIATAKLAADAGITTGMLADDAVTSAKVNFGGSGAGIWWEEIGRTTLGVAGDTITVSSLTAKKYLRIITSVQGTGGTISFNYTFNSDTGSNYSYRISSNGGADSTGTSSANIQLSGAATYANVFHIADVINIAAQEKIWVGFGRSPSTAGAGTAPDKLELVGKWANTSDQISSVTMTNSGTGDFAIGSELIVLGHD